MQVNVAEGKNIAEGISVGAAVLEGAGVQVGTLQVAVSRALWKSRVASTVGSLDDWVEQADNNNRLKIRAKKTDTKREYST